MDQGYGKLKAQKTMVLKSYIQRLLVSLVLIWIVSICQGE